MKHFRFYADYGSKQAKRKGGDAPNAIALIPENSWISGGSIVTEGLVALFETPDSPVNGGGVGQEYLRDCCKRISEAAARRIHPELFVRLNDSSIHGA